ncbi:S24 family peptidase [Bradyrhizobium sp. ORS 375]|uniref:S24 family peptidase n=1 Tax=Bradyrhizobium sp. (strain ORS 375) TaxID=566679 RepID=UPI001FCB498C|nr:S24 family peptidase [Bradyrhizobium sp. ORS 375]
MNAKASTRPHPQLETIKARVEERVTAKGISKNEASRRAGLGLSYVNDLLAGKSLNPSREGLSKLAAILDTDVNYFFGRQSLPRIGTTEPNVAPVGMRMQEAPQNSTIPLFQIGLTDPDGFFSLNPSRRTSWTSPLATPSDTYAVTVPDDTMAPRYRIGEVVVVSPSKPVAHGGFAIVRQSDDRVAIREVVSISPDKISVRMLNGENVIDIARSNVKSLERVIGSCELL